MTISDFLAFFYFDHQNSKFWLFKKPFKAKILELSKNELYVVKLHTNNTRTKFQSNIFIFGYVMVKKRVKVMTSIFWNAIFGISNCPTLK